MALSCVAVDQWDTVTLRRWLLVKPVPLSYCPFYISVAVYRICGHILVKTSVLATSWKFCLFSDFSDFIWKLIF